MMKIQVIRLYIIAFNWMNILFKDQLIPLNVRIEIVIEFLTK